MAAVGGVLTAFIDKVDPNTLFAKSLESIENRNTSELGKLLQKGSISENGYMTGMVVQQVSDIAKGLIEAKKISTEAHSRVQLLAMELAKQALTQQHEIQKEILRIADKHTELLEKITNNNSAIGQSLEKCYQAYLQMIPTLMAIEDREERMMMIRDHKETFLSTKGTLGDISRGNVEMVNSGKIDPAFFKECTKQAGLILSQVNTLAEKFAAEESSQFGLLTSQIGDNIRSLFSKKPETPALIGPAGPSAAPAITDQSGGDGGSTLPQTSSSSSSSGI